MNLQIALLSVTVIVGFMTLTSPDAARSAFVRFSYWIVLIAFLWWLHALIAFLSEREFRFRDFARKNALGLAFALAMTCFTAASVPPRLRILADEANTLNVSRTMTFEKKAQMITMGDYYFFTFHALNREIDKRPVLFQFLTSVVNTVTGYRDTNPFVVNSALLFLTLALLFAALRPHVGMLWAAGTILLVLAQPIVTQSASSGGQEMVMIFFALCALVLLRDYLVRPSGTGLQFLFSTLVLLAHARYESPVFFIGTAAGLLVLRRLPLTDICSRVYFSAVPLLLMPIAWQKLFTWKTFIHNAELRGGAPEKLFSFVHMLQTNTLFVKRLLANELPYQAPVIQVAAFAGIAWFAVRAARGRLGTKQNAQTACLGLFLLAAFWAVITSFAGGRSGSAITSRYYALPVFFFSVIAALFVRHALPRLRAAHFVAGAFCVFLFYHPVSVQNIVNNSLVLTREYHITREFFSKQPDRNFLVISNWPVFYTSSGWGAVNYRAANERHKTLLLQLERRLFRDIFVIQKIKIKTGEPVADHRLPPDFRLETVYELQNEPDTFLRISRVLRKPEPVQEGAPSSDAVPSNVTA